MYDIMKKKYNRYETHESQKKKTLKVHRVTFELEATPNFSISLVVFITLDYILLTATSRSNGREC